MRAAEESSERTGNDCGFVGRQLTSNDTGTPIRRADDAGVHGSVLGHDGKGKDGVGAAGDTGASNASNRATDNQGGAVLGDATDQAADLKDEDGQEKGDFEREVLVRLAPGGLEGAESEEEGTAIPSNVVDAVELVGDGGDGCGDDGHVKGDEENARNERDDDKEQLELGGIVLRGNAVQRNVLLLVDGIGRRAGAHRLVRLVFLVVHCGDGRLCLILIRKGRHDDARGGRWQSRAETQQSRDADAADRAGIANGAGEGAVFVCESCSNQTIPPATTCEAIWLDPFAASIHVGGSVIRDEIH